MKNRPSPFGKHLLSCDQQETLNYSTTECVGPAVLCRTRWGVPRFYTIFHIRVYPCFMLSIYARTHVWLMIKAGCEQLKVVLQSIFWVSLKLARNEVHRSSRSFLLASHIFRPLRLCRGQPRPWSIIVLPARGVGDFSVFSKPNGSDVKQVSTRTHWCIHIISLARYKSKLE